MTTPFHSPPRRPRTLSFWLAATLILGLGGCNAAPRPLDARDLRMFDGDRGTPIDWSTLVRRSSEVDVLLLGEEHDDAFAHAVQRALLASILETNERTALSMEMFERPDQDALDRWSAGEIDTDVMIEDTGARSWGGESAWRAWYQPILDVARERDAPLVAANAPREFVRRARLEGYEVLEALPAESRSTFDIPVSLEQGEYWTKFRDTMRGFRGDDVEESDILDTFKSQMMWDTTMAHSMASALDRPDVDRVVHLVGRFHVDHDGGTTRELRRLRPELSVLTVTCVRSGAGRRDLAEEDLERADVVIYTPVESDRRYPVLP